MGVSPSKSFGEEAIKVIQKDVYISASGQKELATFAAGWFVIIIIIIIIIIIVMTPIIIIIIINS